ncbi:hypothetical protein [Streptomyces sp. DH12]|uniref:hypothetical protein n=1 Tax=Streptomyces sp. DH12 TaxID=2857010 RepID=UPI001E56FC34|nr:hypothetical protein [Streptomyces sp. DH12]
MRTQPVGRYVYWSERLVSEVVEDNGIQLDTAVKSTLKLGALGNGIDVTRADRSSTRFDVAEKLKKKLGRRLAEHGTPGPVQLVHGSGWVEVAEFQRWGARPEHSLRQRTAILHTQTHSPRGQRTDLCLFGSLKNLQGYTVPDEPVGGWVSSSAPAIEEFVASRGAGTSMSAVFDAEGIAVEALRVAMDQGVYAHPDEHRGRPETRAFTVLGFEACEYVVRIYQDVTLTPGRWDFRTEPDLAGAERIMIGAPLWMRTVRPETIRTYGGANRVVLTSRTAH